jgi:hypothetical protein
MIKKLLFSFFLVLVKFAVSFQTKTYTRTTGGDRNRNTEEDKSSKLAPLFFANRFNVYDWKILFVLIFLFSVSFVNAATITSTATGGTWTTASTWVGGIAPVTGDNVIIATTGVNSITLGANASIVNVTINSGATLNIGTVILTVNGVFVNNGTFTGTTGRLYLYGNFSNTGTPSLGSIQVRFYGTAAQTIQGFTTTGLVSMRKTGGTVTFIGNVNGGGLTINGIGGTLNLGSGTHIFTGTWTRTNGALDCGSSLLKIGGSVSGTGGTFTAGTGTVEYNKAATQTGAAVVYNNLTLSGIGTKTFATTPTVNGKLSLEGTAKVVVTTGVVAYGINAILQYNTATPRTATLEEWITPFTSTGGVIIANIGTITMDAPKVFNTSIPLTINSGAKLAMSTFLLTLNGDLINNGGTVDGSTGGVTIAGTAMQNIGAFTTTGVVSMIKTAGTATFTGNGNGAGLTINGTGGTLNLGTGLIHVFTGDVALTAGTLNGGSSILNLNSATTTVWTGTGTNFSAGTGTVIFGGAAQTLAAASTFNNLTFSNSELKTLTGVPTVNGILSMEGIATVSTGPVYGSSATLQYNRPVSQVAGPEWIIPFVATGGVSIINTGTITSDAIKVFNATVPLSIAGGATLDNGGFVISGGSLLSVANGSTLKISGTSAFPVFATTALGTTSTVEYSGGIQPVATKNYGNLALSGSDNKTFLAATTVAGDLAVSGTAVALLNDFSSSVTLHLNGVLQVSSSWGGSSSSATNKDAAKFGSTTTGILNVNISCTAGTWLGTLSTDWNATGNWCGGILPTAATDITITSASTNQPAIGVGASCRNVTITSGATLTVSGSNTLAVSGSWSNNGTFTANSSTINFNGAVGQTIGGTSANIFNNLTNSNTSAIVTATAVITVNNSLNIANIASVLDMSTFGLIDGGTFSNTGIGQLKTSNSSAAPIPAGKTWASTVVYNNVIGGQTIVGGTYNGVPSLELDNASGIQTASGIIITGAQFNINNGGTPTFDMNGFNLTANALNIAAPNAILDMRGGVLSYNAVAAMDGKVRFSGISNGLAFPSGTVEYYGGVQTAATGSYYNILFSGVGGIYTIGNNIDVANTLNVTNGAVTVQDSFSLTIGDKVTVTAPGTLTLENNASLVQTVYTGTNTGNITVKRNSTPLILDDFTYWSSPTTSTQTLLDFSPDTQGDKYFDYDNDWANVNASTTTFVPGIGYAIRSPEGTSASMPSVDTSFQFTGVPNNGAIDIPVTVRVSDGVGERLIGNPYPSTLDADAFIDANIVGGTGTQTISGTLYFWTHNHKIVGNNYDGDVDYATYTKAGGAGVPSGTGNMLAPTRYIASGQGFFAEVDAEGNITFDNSMRVDLSNTNNNFYKSASTLKKQNILEEASRIWLNLTNNTSNGSQILVGYITNATNDFDSGYDGLVYNENQPFSLYSLLGTDKLAIQARALPFVNTDTVPLGYAINTAGDATISIDHVDGVFLEDQNVYLEDKLLNVVHDIKATPYNFASAAGTFNDRFVLRYTDDGGLGIDNFESNDTSIFISKDKNELKIKSELENIKRITVFDLLGRKVFDKEVINSNEFRTSNITLNKQTVIVKVTLINGQVISKKIVY